MGDMVAGVEFSHGGFVVGDFVHEVDGDEVDGDETVAIFELTSGIGLLLEFLRHFRILHDFGLTMV